MDAKFFNFSKKVYKMQRNDTPLDVLFWRTDLSSREQNGGGGFIKLNLIYH